MTLSIFYIYEVGRFIVFLRILMVHEIDNYIFNYQFPEAQRVSKIKKHIHRILQYKENQMVKYRLPMPFVPIQFQTRQVP